MAYKTAKAAYEKADKAYVIAKSTRESLLAEAELAVKFALLDLRKYLGADLADVVIAAEGKADFDNLVNDERLGGEALQQKLKLQSDIDLAQEELQRANSTVEWTRKLESRGYVTRTELEADELKAKRMDVALGQARTALDLFLRYEFPKMAEQYYTDWLEAGRERDRVDARTQSDVDTAQTDLDNKREALRLEETNLEKVREQLAATTITAPQPGMVVFDTGRGRRWGNDEPLEAGATVRHQQELIKLPDLSEMNVEVRLHESVVKQVETGDRALVRVDALPDRRLTGSVTKIAVMPDRTNWWLNPGLKTYTTEVTLEETPEGLKPGMSAQVEILVDRRDDVLQVPISAVHIEKGFQVVYVETGGGIETRRVTVGLSNQQRAEIVEGLKAGERVYLYRPTGAPALDVPEGTKPPEETDPADWGDDARGDTPAASGKSDQEDGPRRGGMPDLKNLTPEQMKKMREHLKNLPEDQRKRVLQQLQKARQGGGSPGRESGAGKRPAGGGRGRRGRSTEETP